MLDSQDYYQDYYRLLRVSKQATTADIKQAFRTLARQYHPDLNPNNPEAAEEFRKLCKAYEILSDGVQRYQYDQRPPARTTATSVVRQDYQEYFLQGVRHANQRNYQGAISAFNVAIRRNSEFVEAYMGRCQARHALGHSRGVLDDCAYILRLQPETAQAYYFRGRAYSRLGYLKSALEAFAQAIKLTNDYAQAYYFRGLTHLDLEDPASAIKDLQTASQLFREQGKFSNVQRIADIISNIKLKPLRVADLPHAGLTTLAATLETLPRVLINPSGGLNLAFRRLLPYQAACTGVIFAAIATGSFIASMTLYWSTVLPISMIKLGVLGSVFFGNLVLSSGIARLIVGARGSWAGDFFLTGSALLLLGCLTILTGPAMQLGIVGIVALAIFTGCYTTVTLYSGYTQISLLSEQIAALAVPVILIVSCGVTVLTYKLVLA